MGGEIQGGLVVVRGEYPGAAGEGDDGGEPDATPQFDGVDTSEVACREVAGQGEGAGPEFRPVRKPLVAVEVFLVDQIVRRDGMRDAVRDAAYLDGRCGQACAAAQMGSESIQGRSEGWSAACGGGFVGCACLTFGGGQGRYAVAPEHLFQGFAGLVPDLARSTKRGVGNVADPAGGAAGGTDLTVQNLDDVEDGDLLRRHREAVSSVRPAATLYDVRPAKLAEDLLQEPLGDALAARDLSHPQRTIALVERELHQRPYRIFALLSKPQEIITACRTDFQ